MEGEDMSETPITPREALLKQALLVSEANARKLERDRARLVSVLAEIVSAHACVMPTLEFENRGGNWLAIKGLALDRATALLAEIRGTK